MKEARSAGTTSGARVVLPRAHARPRDLVGGEVFEGCEDVGGEQRDGVGFRFRVGRRSRDESCEESIGRRDVLLPEGGEELERRDRGATERRLGELHGARRVPLFEQPEGESEALQFGGRNAVGEIARARLCRLLLVWLREQHNELLAQSALAHAGQPRDFGA